jgi:YesN/AraC family two-component response regulator
MGTPAPVRVVLVDDQALVRDGLRLILELAGIDVVGEAADGAAAVPLVLDQQPDIVLVDLRMLVMDGVEAIRRIVEAGHGPASSSPRSRARTCLPPP